MTTPLQIARAVEAIEGASIVFWTIFILGPAWSIVVPFMGWGFSRGLSAPSSGVAFYFSPYRTSRHCAARSVASRGAGQSPKSHRPSGGRYNENATRAGFDSGTTGLRITPSARAGGSPSDGPLDRWRLAVRADAVAGSAGGTT